LRGLNNKWPTTNRWSLFYINDFLRKPLAAGLQPQFVLFGSAVT
jgi:hypothetical protein